MPASYAMNCREPVIGVGGVAIADLSKADPIVVGAGGDIVRVPVPTLVIPGGKVGDGPGTVTVNVPWPGSVATIAPAGTVVGGAAATEIVGADPGEPEMTNDALGGVATITSVAVAIGRPTGVQTTFPVILNTPANTVRVGWG